MKTISEFKKGQKVKFQFHHTFGTTRGKGTIVALIPKNADRGGCRLTVKEADGTVRKLFASQLTAA